MDATTYFNQKFNFTMPKCIDDIDVGQNDEP